MNRAHGAILIVANRSEPEQSTDHGDGRYSINLTTGAIGIEVYGTPAELIAWAQQVERLARERQASAA